MATIITLVFIACDNYRPELPADEDVIVNDYPDPLALWNDTPPKTRIVDFIDRVTDPNGQDYVAASDRIAVFDNDGTLWCEQPMYIQLAFAIERATEIAGSDPDLASVEPFRSLLSGDIGGALEGGERSLMEILMVSHANNTTDEFRDEISSWFETARHPRFEMQYNALTYAPMLELLLYLRENEFKTFIVTGGGIDFVRAISETEYGIPPEYVVGSSLKTEYLYQDDGIPVIMRRGELFFVDDKAGKPVGIHHHIGKRPILAFGNSDGDYEMIEWVSSGTGPRLGAFVHHTDSIREYAYDREGHIGVLNRGLDDATDKGWLIIDMKKDWKEIF